MKGGKLVDMFDAADGMKSFILIDQVYIVIIAF